MMPAPCWTEYQVFPKSELNNSAVPFVKARFGQNHLATDTKVCHRVLEKPLKIGKLYGTLLTIIHRVVLTI
jgi:hypothetical protein